MIMIIIEIIITLQLWFVPKFGNSFNFVEFCTQTIHTHKLAYVFIYTYEYIHIHKCVCMLYIHIQHTYTHTSLVEMECHTTVLGGSTEIILCHSISTIQNKYSWSLPNHVF